MNLHRVSRDDWIVSAFALVLAIAVLFLPWFSITVGVGAFTLSVTATATDAPDGWLGVIAALATVAVIADLAIDRLSPQTELPAIGGSRDTTRFVFAVIAAACIGLKFVLHIHFDYFGWGFYVAVVAAAGLVYFTLQARNAGTPTGVY
jgi:hypothetical protein